MPRARISPREQRRRARHMRYEILKLRLSETKRRSRPARLLDAYAAEDETMRLLLEELEAERYAARKDAIELEIANFQRARVGLPPRESIYD